jgi:hypothetical protein
MGCLIEARAGTSLAMPIGILARTACLTLALAACSSAKTPSSVGDSSDDGGAPPGDAGITPGDGDTVSAAGFRHPGILVTAPQLDFVKGKIAAGEEPWTSAFNKAKESPLAALTYAPKPRPSVDCGSNSNPDFGCKDEQSDVAAAYTDALLWIFTGDEAYAKKAIEIMNAWSAVLKTHTLSNAPVQSGWTGAVFPRAAEIIRYTYSGWPADEVARFATMLTTAYLPITIAGTSQGVGSKGLVPNGNWELVMIEASLAIAVFTDDQPTFQKALAMWRARVPSYIYMKSDGPMPVPPPTTTYGAADIASYWGNQSQFNADGMGQETCRDFHHLEYAFAAMIDGAETARIQGVDLYSEQKDRIVAGFEFNAQFLDGTPAPSWLCGGVLLLPCGHSFEIAYNEFANRLKIPMPNTQQFIAKIRPTDADHHMVWETLTHAEVGGVGLDAR